MIPVANQPILYYGLKQLAQAKITEVAIVLGTIHEGIREGVGDGSAFGIHTTYIEQGPPKGLAHAVLCARKFLGDDPFIMYLGDNLLEQGLESFVELYRNNSPDAVLAVTAVPEPRRYGVVEMEGSSIISIEEKPRYPKSNLALVGVYVFSPRIHAIIEHLQPSARGELEITDAIRSLVDSGGRVLVQQVFGWWKDTGTPEDLLEANDLVLNSRAADSFKREGRISSAASLRGRVAVGPDSVIEEGAEIEGPAVLGSGVRVTNGTTIGPETAIGNHVELRSCSIRRSIVLDGARIVGPVRIVDSLIGRNVTVHGSIASAREISLMVGDASHVRL
jgi:glucose-1-phosphate thymidylyltransferase